MKMRYFFKLNITGRKILFHRPKTFLRLLYLGNSSALCLTKLAKLLVENVNRNEYASQESNSKNTDYAQHIEEHEVIPLHRPCNQQSNVLCQCSWFKMTKNQAFPVTGRNEIIINFTHSFSLVTVAWQQP